MADARRPFARSLSLLLAQFLLRHQRCLTSLWSGRELGVVTAVPGRPARRASPFVPLVARAWPKRPWSAAAAAIWLPGLLVPRAIPCLEATAPAFLVDPVQRGRVAGRTVVVVDDTMTTGATLQHAAAALRQAGARSVIGLVLGRVLRPEAADSHARYWEIARAIPFDLGRCALGCRAGAGPLLSGPGPGRTGSGRR